LYGEWRTSPNNYIVATTRKGKYKGRPSNNNNNNHHNIIDDDDDDDDDQTNEHQKQTKQSQRATERLTD